MMIIIMIVKLERVASYHAVAIIEDTEVMSTVCFWECGWVRGVDILPLHTNTHYGFSKADLCS